MTDALPAAIDVVIIGAGNAALCAALSAAEHGASVLVLEAASEAESGGNSRFTAGAFRVAYDGVEDLRGLMPDLTDDECAMTDFGAYPASQFLDDLHRVTEYRTDPMLSETLTSRSYDTLRWMQGLGVRFNPIWGRQAYKVDGRFVFWGGLTVEAWGGGPGLVDSLHGLARKAGITIAFETPMTGLISDDSGVTGVRVRHQGRSREIAAKAVVLACGGFESNTEWRTRYLGPGWDLAKVRGTRFNNGDGLKAALDIGARAAGNWSGCHAVGWDRAAPEFGDLEVGDNFQKHSYPLGIMINSEGERFVDEGADFRNYTYAKYGAVILRQPGQFAWQIFDAKVADKLRAEYRIRRISKVSSDTLEGLAAKLEGVNAAKALETLNAWNAAVMTDVPFDPNVKDGRGTRGLAVPKSNWANRLDTPPYDAYAVTCGVTFTFGGLAIDENAQVLATNGEAIRGLYAAGEMVGGLFYFNYPGGSGLMSGAVFGKIAGAAAARA